MNKDDQRGISAITAATMIATGSIGTPTSREISSSNPYPPKRRLSFWKAIKSNGHNKVDDEENRKTSTIHIKQQDIDSMINKTESLTNIISSLSSAYATTLICIFVAFSFTELVTFPSMYRWLDIHGFFVYLYVLGNIYLLYLIFYVLKRREDTSKKNNPKVFENPEVSISGLIILPLFNLYVNLKEEFLAIIILCSRAMVVLPSEWVA